MEFKLPDLGEGIEKGEIVSVLVSPGDAVEADQSILELETDKAVVELPCPHAGQVARVHVEAGQVVAIGDLILTLDAPAAQNGAPAESPAEARDSKASVAETAAPAETVAPAERTSTAAEVPAESAPSSAPSVVRATPDVPPENTDARAPAPAGPATRRLARELGVDLYQISGTGPAGRITMDDVKAFVRQIASGASVTSAAGALPADEPLPDFSRWGEVEIEPLKGVRKATASAMAKAWSTVPHVTQFDVADITELEAARKSYGARQKALAERARAGKGLADVSRRGRGKITVTVLALKAVVAALQEFPQFNCSIDTARGQIIRKKYFHIGVAVDTPHGLMVPVLRDVDRKSLDELAAELGKLAARARDRKLDIDDMRGGTFTITNLGGIGGVGFTPIVNHPEVAILGIARGSEEVRIVDGQPVARLRMPLCLSYDHRVIDGADGARFTRAVAELLEDPFRLLVTL